MSLYTVSLNHSRKNSHLPVAQEGIDELARSIVSSTSDPSTIVVSISGSSPMLCDRGDVPDSDGAVGSHNGECLTWALTQATKGAVKFRYVAWWYWIGGPTGVAGQALILGSRWNAVAEDGVVARQVKTKDGAPKALGVLLQDTKYSRGRVPLYIFHAGPPFSVNIEPVLLQAVARDSASQFAPLFVGDFNMAYRDVEYSPKEWRPDEDSRAMTERLNWLNRDVVCEDGTGFAMQHQIEQVESGLIPGDQPNTDPAVLFTKSFGAMRRLNLKYTQVIADKSPTSVRSGIWLPNVEHNGVGLDLAYSKDPSLCDASQQAKGMQEARGKCLPSCRMLGGEPFVAQGCRTGLHREEGGFEPFGCCVWTCNPELRARGWGDKSGQCLPPCRELGGEAQAGAACRAGYASVGNAFDATSCCQKLPVCTAAQTSAGWRERNGVCLPSCTGLGGSCLDNNRPSCRPGYSSAGSAFNCSPCCKMNDTPVDTHCLTSCQQHCPNGPNKAACMEGCPQTCGVSY